MRLGRITAALAVGVLAGSVLPASTASGTRIYVDAALRQDVSAGSCYKGSDPDVGPDLTDKYSVLEGLAYGADKVYIVFGVSSKYDDTHGTDIYEKRGGTVLTRWTLGTGSATCDGYQEGLDLGHGNDVTYVASYKNAATLFVPRGTKTRPNPLVSRLTLNPSGPLATESGTIQFKNSEAVVLNVSAICYTSVADKYAIRVLRTSGDEYIYVYNANSDGSIESIPDDRIMIVNAPNSTGKQGLDCSGNNVYDVQSIAGTAGTTNYVYQFPWGAGDRDPDKTLTYPSSVPLFDANDNSNSSSEEIEGMFHKGDQFYVGVNHNSGAPDRLCAIRWTGTANTTKC